MEKRKVVMCCVLSLLALLSAITAFAAEATKIKRSQIKFATVDKITLCSYPRTPASDLGFSSALFLMMAKLIVSVSSGCVCCKKGAPSSSNWVLSLFCFVLSWLTFVMGFLLLLTAAAINSEHSVETMNAGIVCFVVKPGVFSTGAAFSIVTIALGIVYYLALNSSKNSVTSTTMANQGGGIAMGQPQIPERVEDPVFVHEDTYNRRQFP